MEGAQARTNPLPGILALVGGGIVLIASFLPWGKVSAGQSGLIPEETGNAAEFDFGWFAVAAGAVLLVAGVVMLIGRAPSAWRALGVVAIVAGVIAILVAGYGIVTKDRKVDDAIREGVEETTGQRLTDEQLDQVKAQLQLLGIEVSLQFGIYLTMLGGLVGAVGGILALRAGEPAGAPSTSGFEPAPAPPPAPPSVPDQAPARSEPWQTSVEPEPPPAAGGDRSP
jgi:hypothetical protein